MLRAALRQEESDAREKKARAGSASTLGKLARTAGRAAAFAAVPLLLAAGAHELARAKKAEKGARDREKKAEDALAVAQEAEARATREAERARSLATSAQDAQAEAESLKALATRKAEEARAQARIAEEAQTAAKLAEEHATQKANEAQVNAKRAEELARREGEARVRSEGEVAAMRRTANKAYEEARDAKTRATQEAEKALLRAKKAEDALAQSQSVVADLTKKAEEAAKNVAELEFAVAANEAAKNFAVRGAEMAMRAPERAAKAKEARRLGAELEKKAEIEARNKREKARAEAQEDATEAARNAETAERYILTHSRALEHLRVSGTRWIKKETLVPGKASELEKKRHAVGALLYSGGSYVGFAVPVVEGEAHTTRVAYRAGHNDHDSHVLISAEARPRGAGRDVGTSEGPSTEFIQAMFLDDVCVLNGNTGTDSVRCFRLLHASARRLLVVPSTETVITRKELANETFPDCVKRVLDEIAEEHKGEPPRRVGTHVIPIGYYDELQQKGHQCAFLVRIEKTIALIAMADTGATSVLTQDPKTILVVAFRVTNLPVAERYLELLSRIHKNGTLLTSPNDIHTLRSMIIGDKPEKYAVCAALNVKNGNGAGLGEDPHSAVRALKLSRYGLASHPQRGGSCAYYSLFWLLGIASALDSRKISVTGATVANATVSIDVTGLWGKIASLDRELKQAALPYVSRFPQLAPIIASVYSRCEWLDASVLRAGHEARVTLTSLQLQCATGVRGISVPDKDLLDAGVALQTLRDVALWVRGVLDLAEGVVDATETLLVVLAQKARGVLLEPMEGYVPADKDHESALQIAHFLSYLSGKTALANGSQYATSLCCGMLARCARLAVRIARPSKLNVHRDGTDDQRLVVNATHSAVTTCLPWAAKEYCAFLRDARGVLPLLYSSESPYMDIQAECGRKNAQGTMLNAVRGEAIFEIRSMNNELAGDSRKLFPEPQELAEEASISALANSDRYENAAQAIKSALQGYFGVCPEGFEKMSVRELSNAVYGHLRITYAEFIASLGLDQPKDIERAVLAAHRATKPASEDARAKFLKFVQNPDASLLSGAVEKLLERAFGWLYSEARKDFASARVDPDRAMLLAVPRAIELGLMTHEERVGLLSTAARDSSPSDTILLHVQACITLALVDCAKSAKKNALKVHDNMALKERQLRALRYLCTDPSVAALNVIIHLLNLAHEVKGDNTLALASPSILEYVIGYSSGIMMFRNTRGVILKGPTAALVAPPRAKSPYEQMLEDTEWLYVRTSEQRESDAREVPPWLTISIFASRPKLAHDVEELVRWGEFVDASECRTGEHAIRSYTTPLSLPGATLEGIAKLAEFASAWNDAPLSDLRALLEGKPGGLMSMSQLRKEGSEFSLAYFTVAVLKGRAREMIRAELDTVQKYARETPYARWAPHATRARLARLTDRFASLLRMSSEGGKFVFAARGGVIGRLHERLDGAGCTFDHWRNDDTSEIELERGVKIRGTDEELTLELLSALPGKKRTMKVFVGESDYWDPTVGACVVPIGVTRVECLVVVPGTRGSEKSSGQFVSCDWVKGESSSVRSVTEHFSRLDPFVVELDEACLLPAASTPTSELVALFVAYGYAGSMCGTRLIPLVASHAVGEADGTIMRVLYGAPCPLSFYAVCASSFRAFRELRENLASMLRCAPEHAARELRAKMLWEELPAPFVADLREAEARVRLRARMPMVRYGDCERDFVLARSAAADGKKRKMYDECVGSYHHADAWKTALEASTGRLVRDDQRARVERILEESWAVVQMQMGFGKSSVIVPLLVARYLSRANLRVILVTQPAHLVPQALRTVGSLIAAHPWIEPVYVLSAADFVRGGDPSDAKLVLVLSTSDMQRLVRDNPRRFYDSAEVVAHIADEVDEESDPLKCEVVVEGAEKTAHYTPDVAANVGVYYRAALELGTSGGAMKELSKIHAKSAMRLAEAHRTVETLVHKVNYGLSSDPEVYIAVPYVCANKPSLVSTFSDIDVAISLLVLALARGMRKSDRELVERDIRAKLGRETGDAVLAKLDDKARLTYYATQIAMPRLRVSKKESSVSFVDLLGIAATFVGFSGTMGASVRVPEYDAGDKRSKYMRLARECVVPVHSDQKSDEAVRKFIGERPAEEIRGAPSKERAQKVLGWIKKEVAKLSSTQSVCIVDGSGEFGSFDDDLAAVQEAFNDFGGVGHFDERGQLVGKDRRVRYYSHRDARGVDSEMPDTAIGFVVLAVRTRLSDAAQAVYRLRGLEKGQTVRIVLASEGSVLDWNQEFTLVDMLLANEQEHAESAERVLRKQLEHAKKPKESAHSFEREVTIYSEDAEALRTSEKQQQQTQEKVAVATRESTRLGCFAAKHAPTAHATLQNGAKTEISDSLAALRVGLSPFLTYTGWTERKETRRRAFAVVHENGARRLVVMALAEVWTRSKGDTTPYDAYASDGRKLRGESSHPGRILLLGRYLCDDPLSLLEEYELLFYLRDTYKTAEEREALKNVVSCLWGSRFLIRPTQLLHCLAEGKDPGAGKNAGQVLKSIRDDMFNGAGLLDEVLMPYVNAIAASAAFGKRRFV